LKITIAPNFFWILLHSATGFFSGFFLIVRATLTALDKRLMKHIEAGILNCNSVLPYARLTNEWLVRDTSKKVRAVKQLKGMSVKAPRGGVGVKSN